VAVAGFVSNFEKWKQFELTWNKILEREGVSCLHMTDFVSFQGEFKAWKGQQHSTRRREFILNLFDCARRLTNKAFAAAIPMVDYRLLDRSYQLAESGMYPFPICGRMCVDLTEKWRRKYAIQNVLYVFEDGDQHKGHLQSLCREVGIEPEFVNKRCAPVQAADLLAWRTRSAFAGALKPDLTFDKADSLQATFDQTWKLLPHEAFCGEAHRLERLCLERGVPKRNA